MAWPGLRCRSDGADTPSGADAMASVGQEQRVAFVAPGPYTTAIPPVFGPCRSAVHRRFAQWSRAREWARLHCVILDAPGAGGEPDRFRCARGRRCPPPVDQVARKATCGIRPRQQPRRRPGCVARAHDTRHHQRIRSMCPLPSRPAFARDWLPMPSAFPRPPSASAASHLCQSARTAGRSHRRRRWKVDDLDHKGLALEWR